ncbi:TM2 domain-containing protein [Candidatus Saccharibacteria bacterium]|nr:TM2 domain-containing protein [Candidatus Saccharibacteria bacterium]
MDKEAEKQKIEGYLAIFLGSFGAHNFYRGKIGAGILRIILGWGPAAIIASPLSAMVAKTVNGDLESAIILAIVFLFIIVPIIIIAPIISIITGVLEGIDILKKKPTTEAEKNNPGLRPGGEN